MDIIVGTGLLRRHSAHLHSCTHTAHSGGNRRDCVCLSAPKKTPRSYIKFSPGQKPGPAVTLGGRVLNDIHQPGSDRAVVSTEDRPFWSICWAGGARGSGWETSRSAHRSERRWVPVNYNWLQVLSFQFFWSFRQTGFLFLSSRILLRLAQRWSASRAFSLQTTNLDDAGSSNNFCPHSIKVRKENWMLHEKRRFSILCTGIFILIIAVVLVVK